jgi:hypothetical protein
MWLPVLLIIVGVALTFVFADIDVHRSSGWAMPAGIVSILVALFGAVCLLVAGTNRLQYGADVARISAVRAAAADVDPNAGHDIYGQASQVNQEIAGNKWIRGRWFVSWTISAGWDTMTAIPLPHAHTH